MNPDETAQRARDAGVRLVRFLYCDNGGVIRGKSTAVSGLEGRLRDGIGLTLAMMAMNSLDQLQKVEGMGPVGFEQKDCMCVPNVFTATLPRKSCG